MERRFTMLSRALDRAAEALVSGEATRGPPHASIATPQRLMLNPRRVLGVVDSSARYRSRRRRDTNASRRGFELQNDRYQLPDPHTPQTKMSAPACSSTSAGFSF